MIALHAKLREALEKLGYERLLPVQEKAIPVILSGSHTLIVAPTGSGKTEAAIIPILSMMLNEAESNKLGGGVKLVYVSPLRALNRDIESRISRLSESVGFTVQVRHGDSGVRDRKKFLEKPPDIVITTPETLNLILTLKEHRNIWSNVGWVIVDEVHDLLESERGSELSVVLERLQEASKRRIQRVGLSATLSDKTMRHACSLIAGSRPVTIVVDPHPKAYNVTVEVVETSKFWEPAVAKVAEIISSNNSSTLIFANTRHAAELLASNLSNIMGNSIVAAHHGSLSKHVREDAERGFKEGMYKALVATSSMELGVDIGKVGLVVQFLSPRQVTTMMQRAGRAGHRFLEVSRGVITTINNIFEMLESGVIALRVEKGHVEDFEIHRNPLDALAHQVVAILLEGGPRSLEELHSIMTRAYPFENVSLKDLREVLEHLEGVRIVRLTESSEVKLSRRAMTYFYNTSMIPDERELSVIDMITGRKVGKVSERFIESLMVQAGDEKGRFKFVLAGRVWEALEVDLDEDKIIAKPVALVEGYIPSWEGELIPVSYKVAREVCSIMTIAMEEPGAGLKLLEARKLGASADNIIKVLSETRKLWGITPSFSSPVIEEVGGQSILHVCLGSKGNFALALLLSKIMEKFKLVEFSHIPYAIVFKSLTGVKGGLVAAALKEAKSIDKVERLAFIHDSLRRSKAFTARFYHVARRMGVIDVDAKVGAGLLGKIIEAYRGSVVERETLRELVVDKLDIEALNQFLEALEEPHIVSLREPSPLTLHVLGNPYIRSDVSVNIKLIALDQIIEAKKKHLNSKTVTLLCAMCADTLTIKVSDVKRDRMKCAKCSNSLLAPLPDSEWGRQAIETYVKYLKGGKLSREEKKIIEEVRDRAGLYLNYSTQGLGDYAVKALMTRGVGPRKAKRVLEELLRRGERGFYEELLKAEEEYIETRRYWDKKSYRGEKQDG